MDLEKNIILGVSDLNKKMVKKNPNYINAGVVLMDLDKIREEKIEEKINTLVDKYKYKLVKFEKIEVKKAGEMDSLNQKVPYVKVIGIVSNLPIKDVEGIVGVAKLENGKNLIVISVNEKDKYSQIIADGFYNKVK